MDKTHKSDVFNILFTSVLLPKKCILSERPNSVAKALHSNTDSPEPTKTTCMSEGNNERALIKVGWSF